MTTVTIDENEYILESLSEDAKSHLASLNFVDAELARLNAQAAALQTARIAYGNELKRLLPGADSSKLN